MPKVRISDHDLTKAMVRAILEASPEEAALMAENLLGVKATYDQKEYWEWEIEPAENYCGALDAAFGITEEGTPAGEQAS